MSYTHIYICIFLHMWVLMRFRKMGEDMGVFQSTPFNAPPLQSANIPSTPVYPYTPLLSPTFPYIPLLYTTTHPYMPLNSICPDIPLHTPTYPYIPLYYPISPSKPYIPQYPPYTLILICTPTYPHITPPSPQNVAVREHAPDQENDFRGNQQRESCVGSEPCSPERLRI